MMTVVRTALLLTTILSLSFVQVVRETLGQSPMDSNHRAAIILVPAASPAAAATKHRTRLADGYRQFGRYRDRQDYERFGGQGGGPRPPLAPETNDPLPDRRVVVPMVFPVIGNVRWRNGYNVSRGTYRHTGIDIQASKMQPVVAPFSGILGFKTQTFWIFGDNGYKCLGTHLNDDTPGTKDNRAIPEYMFAPNLRPGDHVVTGQLIGYVGDSGNATGPHLHFELFARDGMLVNAFYSLERAGHMTAPQPILTGPKTRPTPGLSRLEGCIRKWDPAHRMLTLLLVTRQNPDGRAYASARPTWYRLALPPDALEAAGGSEKLEGLPRDRAMTCYVEEHSPRKSRMSSGAINGLVHRIVLSPTETARLDGYQ